MGRHAEDSPPDIDRISAWIRAHLDPPQHVLIERCTCTLTPQLFLKPNPECPVHFPKYDAR